MWRVHAREELAQLRAVAPALETHGVDGVRERDLEDVAAHVPDRVVVHRVAVLVQLPVAVEHDGELRAELVD